MKTTKWKNVMKRENNREKPARMTVPVENLKAVNQALFR
ncbi:hypothetical protein PEC301877_16310 [Pectobacterium carotovorum subsp. carotovorum]|nr:hypothetical protein PEC301877_16310 [Pectobacterium carotovorum subsp. carotovorum]